MGAQRRHRPSKHDQTVAEVSRGIDRHVMRNHEDGHLDNLINDLLAEQPSVDGELLLELIGAELDMRIERGELCIRVTTNPHRNGWRYVTAREAFEVLVWDAGSRRVSSLDVNRAPWCIASAVR